MGNMSLHNKKSLVHFFDGVNGLAQMLIFFLLGLLAFPSQMPKVLLPAIAIALFLTFVARPVAVFAILTPLKCSVPQQIFVSMAGLRGAASIVFAIMATVSPTYVKNDIFHIVICIVLFSISFQGSLLGMTAKKLDMMDKNAKIYVAGHRGMVGSAIVRELERQGYTNIVTRTHKELNLCRQDDVEKFFAQEKPEYVFLAAAKVGGIVANEEALADFMYDNMTLEMNVIHSAWQNGCKKLEFLGSSCIYPRMAPQPMKEDCLLTGELEKTNEAYALAKISGLKYCEFLNRQYGTDYISVMPTNLYGPNDNYHPTHSHVLPALIRRFHEAKVNGVTEVTCWGDGSPLREFLYVDDLANLCVFLMNHYSGNETVNAGTGKELTIKELTEMVAEVIGYTGKIKWDTTKPNGTPRKLLNVSKAADLGWTYKTELKDGIRLAYEDFLNNPMRAER